MKFNRLYEIEAYLAQKQYASIDELVNKFGISIQTLRRDLSQLQKQNTITKLYGGVIYNKNKPFLNDTPDINERLKLNIDEKIAIGKMAASFVEDNDIIFIDSGSTTIHMIPFLASKNNITIVTHSLDIMDKSAQFSNLNCIALGGKYQTKTRSFYSDTANHNYYYTKAFITTIGISIPRGCTNENNYEAAIKTKVINNAAKVYLLADHTKFDVIAFNNFATFDKINTIITDTFPSEQYTTYFKRNNIQLFK